MQLMDAKFIVNITKYPLKDKAYSSRPLKKRAAETGVVNCS
jgi:hypothetical protein